MEQLKMQTPNLADEKYKKLKELFPNAITEAKDDEGNIVRAIDKDILMQEINTFVVDGPKERFGFKWPGKKDSILNANKSIDLSIRINREKSIGANGERNCISSKNVYIEGDNLDALKLLHEAYLGSVKMIYIDPPYNTGEDFIYQDEFFMDESSYLGVSNQVDEVGYRMVANKETNGRFHTDWLNMLYPRLKLARDFLTDDGIIFISIDENEVASLQQICDEIYGAHNFIAQLIWSGGRKNDSKYISVSHEYILCYFKNKSFITEQKILWRTRKEGLDDIYRKFDSLVSEFGDDYPKIESALKQWYKDLPEDNPAKQHKHYSCVDENGIYFPDNISWPGGGGPSYDILHPTTHKPVKVPSRGWLTNKETMEQWIKDGRVAFGLDENSVPTLKAYLKDRELAVPYSVIYKDGRASSKRLAEIMGDKVFDNPKDEEVLKEIINFANVNDNDIIMDFFSGSASTAHAVFLSNIEKHEHKQFILVQIPEEISVDKVKSESRKKVVKNALKLIDELGAEPNLCSIGEERIKRVGDKFRVEGNTDVDLGMRVFEIGKPIYNDVSRTVNQFEQDSLDFFESNISDSCTSEDLVIQIMLELGCKLSENIETTEVLDKTIYNVANGYIVACFDDGITPEVVTEIAKMKPVYAVFKNSSIASDALMTNFEQIFETYSPNTKRRVI